MPTSNSIQSRLTRFGVVLVHRLYILAGRFGAAHPADTRCGAPSRRATRRAKKDPTESGRAL